MPSEGLPALDMVFTFFTIGSCNLQFSAVFKIKYSSLSNQEFYDTWSSFLTMQEFDEFFIPLLFKNGRRNLHFCTGIQAGRVVLHNQSSMDNGST